MVKRGTGYERGLCVLLRLARGSGDPRIVANPDALGYLITPETLYRYGILDQMEREAEDRRWQALFETIRLTERAAYMRAGTVAAMIVNVNLKAGATPLTANDIFPFLADAEDANAEMTTAETVAYLKAGFGLYVEKQHQQFVGLSD